jgi:hypothetical protein
MPCSEGETADGTAYRCCIFHARSMALRTARGLALSRYASTLWCDSIRGGTPKQSGYVSSNDSRRFSGTRITSVFW